MIKNTVCITYNNPTHKRFQEEFEVLYANKFSQYHAYTKEWLSSTQFYHDNYHMFSYEKYAGYFLWKPFCISVALDSFYTDQVLYCDSNLRFTNFSKFEKLYLDIIHDQGVFFIFHRNYINKDWTKKDAFVFMNADEPEYWNAHQVWSVILGFTREKRSQEILKDYLYYCRNENIVTELPNTTGENYPGFVAHRWEQSVISILAERYGVYTGVYDDMVLDTITKVYDTELYTYKKQVDEHPLQERKIE